MTAALFVTLSAFAVEVDGIAARVGSSVILKSAVLGEMRRAGVGEEKYAEVRGEMIERELILRRRRARSCKCRNGSSRTASAR